MTSDLRDTDQDWARVAADNPYWGVLSADQFRGSALSPEAEREFFASGEKLIQDVIAFCQKYIVPDFKPRRSLDFGCGVGRLLIPLARQSEQAVGVDVVPKMLDLARANIARYQVKNAQLVLGDDRLSRLDGKFDFINTYITLQHIPPARGTPLILKLLSLLEIGGAFSIQLTYAKERRFFIHEQNKARFYRRDGTFLHDLLPAEDARPEGTITMFDYDLNEVALALSAVAGEPMILLATNHDGHRGIHFLGVKARHA